MGTVNVKSTPKNVISPVSTTPKETIAKNAPKDTLEFRSMVANVKVNSTFSNILNKEKKKLVKLHEQQAMRKQYATVAI